MPKKQFKSNNQWCERHWSPYRDGVDDKFPNGIFASIKLMEEFINSPIVAELVDKSPTALNRNMEKASIPVCCRLGDGVMNRILDRALELGTNKTDYVKK